MHVLTTGDSSGQMFQVYAQKLKLKLSLPYLDSAWKCIHRVQTCLALAQCIAKRIKKIVSNFNFVNSKTNVEVKSINCLFAVTIKIWVGQWPFLLLMYYVFCLFVCFFMQLNMHGFSHNKEIVSPTDIHFFTKIENKTKHKNKTKQKQTQKSNQTCSFFIQFSMVT